MAFKTPEFPAISESILRDIANQLPAANMASDGDFAIRANATGAAIEGLYQHQQWIVRQVLPDTADADHLERWASLFGLTRKASARATGSINFSGTPGGGIPLGTEAKTTSGIAFVTTVAGVLSGAGTASLAAQAVLAGAAGNQAADTALTLTAAPPGVLSNATIATMTGGVDSESNASLLTRLLYRLRYPPHGGAAHDYIAWALEVSGVSAAYVYPLRRGVGTVDVVIVTAGGLPPAPLVDDVQSHIDGLRPVTADCLVLGPTAVPVAVSAALTLAGTTLAAATLTIETALAAYFATLKPGDTVYRNRILALITEAFGVVDCLLAEPAGNVVALVDPTHVEQAILGVVTLT